MTPEQLRQVETLFHRGKDLSPEDRRALLDAQCGDDPEVRAEVEKRLAHANPDETTAAPRDEVTQPLRLSEADPALSTAGPAIEGYDILREIHRGGQGVVYQAVQKSTKRKVAIKVLLEGPYASKSARRRFEREIELVAQLKHPNVIGVFHSGQTSDDRQYCVMDYVRGTPLDQYVRNEKLTLEDALKLFVKVCEAVNYAHQKGVIHRDLKPSNILVDSGGEPKVLDFGLAKQLVDREASLVSLTGQVVGTLPYMSPEQAEGNPDKIDIRTDVYALGVILYQMLTGCYPYPVAGNMADVLKHIAETPPTPPSRSWKSDSGLTRRTRKRIRPGQCPIDDEVQTIVLRTLAKERQRRYQSAGELARDIGHYLADEPIEAKRDSGWYVLRKHLRRYRLPIAAAALFVVVITVSLVVSVSLWRQAERDRAAAVLAEKAQSRARQEAEQARDAETEQRQEAERQARIAQAVNDFLHNDLLASVSLEAWGRQVTVREVLDAASKKIEGRFADAPVIEASIRSTLGNCYRILGEYAPAGPHLTRALELYRRVLGEEHPNTLGSMYNLAGFYLEQGRYDQAEPLHVKTLELRRRVLGEEHPDTLHSMNYLAVLYEQQGRYDQAEPLYVKTLEVYRRVLGEEDPLTLLSMHDLANLYRQQGRYDQAEPLFVKTLEVQRRVLDEEHPDTLLSMRNLAELLRAEKKQDQARPYVRQLLALRKKAAERTGADAIDLNAYAWELLTCEPADLRDPVAALPVARKAVRKRGGKDPGILDTLALAHFLNGDVAMAIETEEKALSLLPPGNSPLRKALEESLAGYRTAASQPATTQPANESGE